MDASALKKLANLLNKENLAEIELGKGEDYIRITRTVSGGVVASVPAAQPTQIVTTVTDEPTPAILINNNAVKSPIVGTAYLSPSPEADPFVKVGDTVKKGDTLLIVEAMKTMNPIIASTGGVVQDILVSDAQPVEYDQPLIIIA